MHKAVTLAVILATSGFHSPEAIAWTARPGASISRFTRKVAQNLGRLKREFRAAFQPESLANQRYAPYVKGTKWHYSEKTGRLTEKHIVHEVVDLTPVNLSRFRRGLVVTMEVTSEPEVSPLHPTSESTQTKFLITAAGVMHPHETTTGPRRHIFSPDPNHHGPPAIHLPSALAVGDHWTTRYVRSHTSNPASSPRVEPAMHTIHHELQVQAISKRQLPSPNGIDPNMSQKTMTLMRKEFSHQRGSASHFGATRHPTAETTETYVSGIGLYSATKKFTNGFTRITELIQFDDANASKSRLP